MTLIGLGGKYGAGKDVVADWLVENKNFVKLGMSDTLRQGIYELNPWIKVDSQASEAVRRLWNVNEFASYREVADTVGYVEAKTLADARTFLQVLGTEVGRKLLGEDIWVDASCRAITAELIAGRDVVITGIRYWNELDMISDLNGHTVWIDRPSLKNENTHDSENTLSDNHFSWTINNNTTLDALALAAEQLIRTIKVWGE